MKTIAFLCFSAFFLLSCKADVIYKLQIQDVKGVQENILSIEKLIKKIPKAPHYEYNYPEYTIDDNGHIYITYSNIMYDSVDSIVESRHNPNCQRIDNLSSVKELTTNEFSELKKNINFLKGEKIESSEYLYNEFTTSDFNSQIIKEYKCPFFAYPYDFQKWMAGNPDMISYIVILNNEQLKSKCFTNFFEVKDKKDNLYLVVRRH